MPGPLSDVKVLDLTQVLAGPFATTILSDFGADMIKIEPPEGDYSWQLLKSRPIEVRKLSGWIRRRNRRSITLDLTSDKGKEIFIQLVQISDVVIQNYRRPVMDRLGLGYDTLKEANPQIIYCAMSGFGQTGPYMDRMAYDPTVQAASGIMSMTGFTDKPPVRVGMQLADYCVAVYAVIGTLLALHHRDITGQGQMIDAAMFDAMCHWTVPEIGGFLLAGGKRLGNRHPWAVPMDAYLTKDEKYLLWGTQTDEQWESFLKMIGKEELIGDKWSFNDRLQRREEIEPWAKEWTRNKTLEEAEHLLNEADLPSSRVTDIFELPDDPQVLVRELILEVDDPECGSLRGITGIVPKLLGTPGAIIGTPPAPGQHNEEILCGILGYSKKKLIELKDEGVI